MRSLRTLELELPPPILGLVLALGSSLTAVAQNSAPSPQPEAAPPTQSNPAQDAQQHKGPAQGQGTSVDEELQLTQDQKDKIAALVDDENKEIGAVRDDASLTLEQKQQKVLQIRQAAVPKIKAVLTPEQLQKLSVIQERNRQQQQNSPPTPQR